MNKQMGQNKIQIFFCMHKPGIFGRQQQHHAWLKKLEDTLANRSALHNGIRAVNCCQLAPVKRKGYSLGSFQNSLHSIVSKLSAAPIIIIKAALQIVVKNLYQAMLMQRQQTGLSFGNGLITQHMHLDLGTQTGIRVCIAVSLNECTGEMLDHPLKQLAHVSSIPTCFPTSDMFSRSFRPDILPYVCQGRAYVHAENTQPLCEC